VSSYQPTTSTTDPGSRWLTFTAAVAISAATRDWLANTITVRRWKIRSRWRKLDPATQATLVLAFLRTNLTYTELALANQVSTATCRRIVNEGIDLLAQRAPRLSEVVRLAKKAGWEYLLIDGVNVPTVAFERRLNRRQRHYSGKHRRHGVNVQTVCAPDGRLLWASAALPGKVNDITAARRHGLAKKIGTLLGILADLGYVGLEDAATGFRKPRRGQLTPAQRDANQFHASLRCLGERGNAQLKWFRVLATELRCRPNRCTAMIKAVLTVYYREQQPFMA
jgi:DDE superfamily endonuclease/Helix-turn-helix of DDE superfamily endonuclease